MFDNIISGIIYIIYIYIYILCLIKLYLYELVMLSSIEITKGTGESS